MDRFWGNGNGEEYVNDLPIALHAVLEYHEDGGNIVRRSGFQVNVAGVFWVVSGLCRVTVNGETQELSAGQMFYVLFRESYRMECLSDVCYRCLGFYGPLAEAILLSYRLPRFLDIERPVEPIWNELISLASSRSESDRRHVAALIVDIFSCLAESDASGGSGERLIKQAMRLIHHHLADPDLGVDFLCEKLSVSRPHLTAVFRKYEKFTPGRSILNRRLARAYALLRGSDYPIAKVAGQCGFRDPKTFSRFIRRSSGMGPSAFREKFRRESEEPGGNR